MHNSSRTTPALLLALATLLLTAPVATAQPTSSRWTSITPDQRQFATQPGGATPLAVVGLTGVGPLGFRPGQYMIYTAISDPDGRRISRWKSVGPVTLKAHEKWKATLLSMLDPEVRLERNTAELVQYSDPGESAMIYGRNSDKDHWRSICVLPAGAGMTVERNCFGGSSNVEYVRPTGNHEAAWWQAEGNANDSAGGAHGIPEGVSFASGKIGQAFRFDGRNSSVRVPDTPRLDITDYWTLTAWVYTTSLAGHKGGAQGVISKVGGRSGNYGYQFGILDGSGEVLLQFNEAGQGWPGPSLKAGKVPLNTWTFIAGRFDNKTMSIYVNGVLAGSKAVGPRRVANSSSNFRIGLDDNGNVDFSGMIDEVRVFDRALSDGEIRSLGSTPVAVRHPAGVFSNPLGIPGK